MPGNSAAVFRDVHVKYGTVTALDGLDLEIPEKGVFALLGRNGAGKTTAIRAVTGLVWLSAGILNVLEKIRGRKVFKEAGFLFCLRKMVSDPHLPFMKI